MFERAIVVAFCLIAGAGGALADSTTGAVVAYDRKAQVIVLEDKTIWSLEGSKAELPADLQAGERIEIDYESGGDNGIIAINTVKRVTE